MIQWAYFPQSGKATATALSVIQIFERHQKEIDSETHEKQVSDVVLARLADDLEELGFQVERGKKKDQKINVPVLSGRNGKVQKSFEADARMEAEELVLEVEAGRGVTNYQFLKDLFQASMMQGVNYLGIAVRNVYRSSRDFDKICVFFDTLYTSNRLSLPLKGVLIIGY